MYKYIVVDKIMFNKELVGWWNILSHSSHLHVIYDFNNIWIIKNY